MCINLHLPLASRVGVRSNTFSVSQIPAFYVLYWNIKTYLYVYIFVYIYISHAFNLRYIYLCLLQRFIYLHVGWPQMKAHVHIQSSILKLRNFGIFTSQVTVFCRFRYVFKSYSWFCLRLFFTLHHGIDASPWKTHHLGIICLELFPKHRRNKQIQVIYTHLLTFVQTLISWVYFLRRSWKPWSDRW